MEESLTLVNPDDLEVLYEDDETEPDEAFYPNYSEERPRRRRRRNPEPEAAGSVIFLILLIAVAGLVFYQKNTIVSRGNG